MVNFRDHSHIPSEKDLNRNAADLFQDTAHLNTVDLGHLVNNASSNMPHALPQGAITSNLGVFHPELNISSGLPLRPDYSTTDFQSYPVSFDPEGVISRYESQNNQMDAPLADLDQFDNRIRSRRLQRRGNVPMGPLTSLLQNHLTPPPSRSDDILFLPLPVGKVPPAKRVKPTPTEESPATVNEANLDENTLINALPVELAVEENNTKNARATERATEQATERSSGQSSREPPHKSRTKRPRGRPRVNNPKNSSVSTRTNKSQSVLRERPLDLDNPQLPEETEGSTEATGSRNHLIRCKETSYKYLTSYLSLCWNGTQEFDDLILGRSGDQLLQKCERLIKTKAMSIIEGTNGEPLLVFYQDPASNIFINCPTRILPRKVFENTLTSYSIQKRAVEVWEKLCKKALRGDSDEQLDLSDSERPSSSTSDNEDSSEVEDETHDINDGRFGRRRYQQRKPIVKDDNLLVSYARFNFSNPLWYYILRSNASKRSGHNVINALPVSLKLQKLFSSAEYVLMPHIAEFIAPGNEARALDSGTLFSVIQNNKWDRPIVARLLLLIVIRISVSCYSHRDLLRTMAARILEFIWEVLVAGSFSLEAQMSCAFINDFCTQEMMRKAAWKAHLIPVQTVSSARPAYFQEYLHKIRSEIETEALEETQDKKNTSLRFKKQLLNDIRPTLTSHNMALDIFIDLAKSIHPDDTRIGSVNALRWARCFDTVINNSGLTWRNIKLFSVLHRGNFRVAERMTSVYRFGIPVLKFLLWALDALVDEEMLTSAPHVDISPERLCDCLKMIGYMAHDEVTYGLPIESSDDSVQLQAHQFFKVLIDEPVVHVLVRYVLVAPRVNHDTNFGMVYDHVWWILRKTGFVFPYQINQLKQIALDGSVNIHVSGNAAMFVSINWLRANSPEIDLNERRALVETLAMFSLATEPPSAKELLSQLILDISTT